MKFIKYHIRKRQFGTGAVIDPRDDRDFTFDEIALGAPEVNWQSGYDIEKELNIKINLKHQGPSSSCVGQGWSYYLAVINAAEIGVYKEDSAKAFYSQIYLPGGGAHIRDGAKLAVNWGALEENVITSYENSNVAPSEAFMREIGWKTPKMDELAHILQAKEYRVITAADKMDMFAAAIRDNNGVVGGVAGTNNGTWSSNEPKPPTSVANIGWYHCLWFGKYGEDQFGKWIATPNSWGTRNVGGVHSDGWQKLREDYFNTDFMFNPWTLLDRPNFSMSDKTKELMTKNEKKIIMEGEGPGRKGIIVNGKLREITKDRAAEACLYTLTNNKLGVTISTKIWEEMDKGEQLLIINTIVL